MCYFDLKSLRNYYFYFHFLDDVYVPCNATSISSTKIQSIGITDSGTFSVSDASAFTTTSTSVTHSNNNDFTTNDSAIFIDAQIRAVSIQCTRSSSYVLILF